ncbi:heparinase II/III family protein [bacterium]|nr:heparinase II/III family protein [bacterium]
MGKRYSVRTFIGLISLFISVAFLTAAGSVQGVEGHWLASFANRIDPKSEPAKRLHDLGPTASKHDSVRVLAGYFRSKLFIQPHWVIRTPSYKNPEHDTDLADGAVKNFISSMYGEEQFGETLPWLNKDKRVRTIARFPHFDYLLPAYFHTGNEDYARTMVRHMEDFILNAPISLAEHITIQTDYTVNPWNWVLQHWRIMRWIDALDALQDSPSLEDSTYLKILWHLWQEVDWLVPRMILGLHNGTLGNLRAVLYAGLNFPEANNGVYWQNEALSLFKSFLGTYFYPGEVSVELTLGYSSAVLAQCLKIYQALPVSTMKENIGVALEKLVDGHVGLMKPDRSLPRYGDHGNFDLRVDILDKAGSYFNRPDLLGLLDEDSTHSNPPYLSFPSQSRPYYLTGYYAMRDGWGRRAQYLSIDSGPFGTNHQHADKLSITVSADGANFIVDPGTSIYNSTQPGPRYDLRFGFLHNSITVDGIDQTAGWDQHYQFDVLDNRWVTNLLYDFVNGSYDYRSDGLAIIHKRSIFYKRGEYWLLLDALKGAESHYVQSNFQFMFDINLKIETDRIVANAPNGAELQIVSASDGLVPTIMIGDTAASRTRFPKRYPNVDHIPGGRGWVGVFGNHSPYNPHQTHPSPAVVFSGNVALPHYLVRVLSPSKNQNPKPVNLSWLDRQRDHITVKIEHLDASPTTVDIFDMNLDPKIRTSKPSSDESGYWLRLVDGTFTEVIFMNNDVIEYEGEGSFIKLRFSAPAEGYLIRDGQGWELYMDSYITTPVTLLEFQISTDRGAPEVYRDTGQSSSLLDNETGKPASNLVPGRFYTLTQN